ncbi:hypothetical protein ADIARSV_3739 [Arcticibacter svalbardensis MN12-7]|uniref:DUF3575 domain-containing protein n=2 Tax=Arcticibacter TaxID=1288026 RepID=R9GVZ8_9SPHI|nr:hypothetical protein ADIARSV_3739 [Arcticibacter svalbardensis MN12-7]
MAQVETYPKNSFKINLSSLALKNYNFTYERSLARKVSFVAGYRSMPSTNLGQISFVNKALDRMDNTSLKDDLDQITTSNKTYTGEFRFYGGKHAGARGIYLSLYGRYSKFNVDYDYAYSTENKDYAIPISSSLKGLGGGLMIGAQWLIAKRVTFDWYVIGAHYGSLKGDATGIADLSSMTNEEKADLKDDFEGKVSIADKNYFRADVSNNGITAKPDAPFIGIRGLGFNLGIAF